MAATLSSCCLLGFVLQMDTCLGIFLRSSCDNDEDNGERIEELPGVLFGIDDATGGLGDSLVLYLLVLLLSSFFVE